MRKVAIIGIGQTPVGEHWDKSLQDLAAEALHAALLDAQREKLDALFVGNMLGTYLSEQAHLGSLIADYAGFAGIEATTVEAACASGAAAFRQGVLSVASGAKDCVAVVGVEKLTEFSGHRTSGALATAADADFETSLGLTFVALNAMIMRRFMYEYDLAKEAFAHFPILAHQNARHNPNALFKNAITVNQYLKAKTIADPINLLDSSPIADGAAAVILVPYDQVKTDPKAVQVLACEVATDTIALHDRENILALKGVELSTKRAFETAQVTPDDIDLFEVHDAFSIITALSIEASGFMSASEALQRSADGYFEIQGKLPICTMGGLKGRGHPVGATGVYQIVEAAMQLRKEAPAAIQVPEPKLAMTQNIGGTGATTVTTILTVD